jgi:hypothetical protein
LGNFSAEASSLSWGAVWFFYVPTYIRNRVAGGKEPAEKEASLVKGNRSVALILFAGGLVDLIEAIGNLLK